MYYFQFARSTNFTKTLAYFLTFLCITEGVVYYCVALSLFLDKDSTNMTDVSCFLLSFFTNNDKNTTYSFFSCLLE